jgi:hypothetical protein
MLLRPRVLAGGDGDLAPGSTKRINGLQGKAGSAPAGGSTSMTLSVSADPDLADLFPEDEPGLAVTRDILVEG